MSGTSIIAQISMSLTLYLIEKTSNTFENRADPDQAALVRTA